MSNKNFDKLYNLRLKEDERKDKLKVTCKCGWRNRITNRYGKMVCKNCGHMVYLDKRIEFMDKMRKV